MGKVMRRDCSGKKFPVYDLSKWIKRLNKKIHWKGTRRPNLKEKYENYKDRKAFICTKDPLGNIPEWKKEWDPTLTFLVADVALGKGGYF